MLTSLHPRWRAAASSALQRRHETRAAGVGTFMPGRRVRASLSTQASSDLDPQALKDFKVLVSGATGGVGKRVVEVLVEQGVPVRALARDAAKARSFLPGVSSGLVEVVQGDVLQFASLPGALGDANAIIDAKGAGNFLDPLGPYNVELNGTANLVALGRQRGLRKFVLCSSIGADELVNPLNLFWGVLFWKKRGEEELQRSGLDYTIVRPGGLKNELAAGEVLGNVVMQGAGAFGVSSGTRDAYGSRSILRRQVAEVMVAALYEPGAANKVVEIVAARDAPKLSLAELFDSV